MKKEGHKIKEQNENYYKNIEENLITYLINNCFRRYHSKIKINLAGI